MAVRAHREWRKSRKSARTGDFGTRDHRPDEKVDFGKSIPCCTRIITGGLHGVFRFSPSPGGRLYRVHAYTYSDNDKSPPSTARPRTSSFSVKNTRAPFEQ